MDLNENPKSYSSTITNEFKRIRPALSDEIGRWYLSYAQLAEFFKIESPRQQIPDELEKLSLERFLKKNKKPKFIVLTGPGAVGKQSVRDSLDKEFSFFPNMTSRPKRPDEVEGINYLFRPEKEILKAVDDKAAILTRNDGLDAVYALPIDKPMEAIQKNLPFGLEIRLDTWLKLKKEYKDKLPQLFDPNNYLVVFLLPRASHLLALRSIKRNSVDKIPKENVVRQIKRGLDQHWLLDLSISEPSLIYLVNDNPSRVASIIKLRIFPGT